jgi:hypothetical protein
MDDHRFMTRAYLESLTTSELTALAEAEGIDIPPDLERIFIIEELVDLQSDEDNEEDEASPLEEAEFYELAPLPKQYNITFIEVMLRDPLWAYAFWEIKGQDKEYYEGDPDFEGYYLKVVRTGEETSFIVPVGISDTAWYLGFPPEGGRFTVTLCVCLGQEEVVLADSLPFRLPRLLGAPGASAVSPREPGGHDNPLILLSGLADLKIMRNADRLSRIPRQCNP